MDNLCKRCYHNYVCEQYNENRDLTRTKCDYKNSHFVDAVDVAPVRHGRWDSNDLNGYKWAFACSECGWVDGYPFNDRHNYCPNCGAKMDGDIL